MEKKFKTGDRVYHRNLKLYGTFLNYAWESNEECDVDFETDNGLEQRHVSVSLLELEIPREDLDKVMDKAAKIMRS